MIVDREPSEAAREIGDVMAYCHAIARRVSPGSLVERTDGDAGLALVAVDAAPSSDAPVLHDISRLKASGFIVLCYASGADAWHLAERCRLLVSGASDVFDVDARAFVFELRQRLSDAIGAARDREREQAHLREQMLAAGVIGVSSRIAGVFRSIVRVAPLTDLPVLITGETGTGKELAARAVHRLDPRRRDRPFVAVNCGAISAGIAESELFGHRRGAFTGADRDRMGLFRAARGGVLFLDEIGDLEPALQAKLLRVLQEHRVLTVGEDQDQPIDVRVIAATNRDLEVMIRDRAFRADLFHRLNVLTIRIPPLRERPEDIEPLVAHFVDRCGGATPIDAVSPTREFVDAIRHLDLPGNVRQLENIVRRAVVTAARGGPLRLSSLPPESLREISCAPRPSESAGNDDHPPAGHGAADAGAPLDPVAILDAASWKLQTALDLCEQRLVAAALGASHGNRSRAARLLGISPRCIFNKMRKHRLTA
ncbi:MAG TPA: sigma-54 dependent transcriptional regulator [Vicinamibacterales bacterium]|nr:sigma-54 dependent transcriptional regulator [Vicinamibacterales bacterium]